MIKWCFRMGLSVLLFFGMYLARGAESWGAAPEECGQGQEIDSQWGLAQHLFLQNEYYRAITEYKRFVFYFPDDSRTDLARLRIIEAYVRGEWWADGLKEAREFLAGRSNGELSARGLFLQGICQIHLGMLPDARNSLEEAVKQSSDPELRDKAQFLIAETSARGDSWDDAVKALEGMGYNTPLGGVALRNAQWIQTQTPFPEKSPWNAGLLAAILPGAGHLYLGRVRDAGLVFSMNAAFTAATVEAIQKDNPALAAGLAAVELLWYSGNVFSAVGSAQKYNRSWRIRLLEEIFSVPGLEQLPGEWSLDP
jgi:hypothetical protein